MFTMMVGSTDGNTFRTQGKGRTTTITIADGKLLPCIATRLYQRHTSGPHDVPLPVDRLAVGAGLLLQLYPVNQTYGNSFALNRLQIYKKAP